MPEVSIQGGMRVMIPDRQEIREDVRAAWDAKERERVRGVKWMELLVPGAIPAAASLFVPGPDSGYVWSLKLVSAQLASAGTLTVYKATASGDTRRPLAVGASSVTPVVTWSSNQGFLYADQGLYVVGGQNIVNLFITAEQAMAERMASIFD